MLPHHNLVYHVYQHVSPLTCHQSQKRWDLRLSLQPTYAEDTALVADPVGTAPHAASLYCLQTQAQRQQHCCWQGEEAGRLNGQHQGGPDTAHKAQQGLSRAWLQERQREGQRAQLQAHLAPASGGPWLLQQMLSWEACMWFGKLSSKTQQNWSSTSDLLMSVLALQPAIVSCSQKHATCKLLKARPCIKRDKVLRVKACCSMLF